MEHYKVTIVCDPTMKEARHHFKMVFLRSTTSIVRHIYIEPEEKTRVVTVHGKPYLVIGQTHVDFESNYPGCERKNHMKILETDVFLALFPVMSRQLFKEVETKLIPKIRSHCPKKPIIIVATEIECRADSRLSDVVSSAEVHKMALKMKTSYWETSAKRNFGVTECFCHAVELGILNKGNQGVVRRKKRSVIIPPLRPPAKDTEPIVKALPSTFVEDWLQALSDPKFYDVRFILGQRHFIAHKAILCSASSFFMNIFSHTNIANKYDVMEGKIKGIQKVYDAQDSKQTVVNLDSDIIKDKTFIKLLEKLYTDVIETNMEKEFGTGKCVPWFQQQFDHQKSSKVSDEKVQSMEELLKEGIFSDMDFIVKGTKLPAHKVVVCARCPNLIAMEESLFMEGESRTEVPISHSSVESFQIFLEFLYTDRIQMNASTKVADVCSLAHRYGVDRLVTLCEEKMMEELDTIFWNELHMTEEELLNAVELITRYKECHALQMVEWCRYYISQNYSKYSEREGLSFLDCEDREHVKQHQWPPTTYVKEMDEFWTNNSS